MCAKSIKQSSMALARLSDIYGAAAFVVENIHADLLAEINNSTTAPTFQQPLIAPSTPENAVATPHQSVVLYYSLDALFLSSPHNSFLRVETNAQPSINFRNIHDLQRDRRDVSCLTASAVSRPVGQCTAPNPSHHGENNILLSGGDSSYEDPPYPNSIAVELNLKTEYSCPQSLPLVYGRRQRTQGSRSFRNERSNPEAGKLQDGPYPQALPANPSTIR
jgi:hypothetical protein